MTTMKESLGLNQNTAQNERLSTMITIKDDYLSGRLNLLEARALLKDKIGTCTPDEFAYGEQQLKGSYTDEEITHRMDELLELFDTLLLCLGEDIFRLGITVVIVADDDAAFPAAILALPYGAGSAFSFPCHGFNSSPNRFFRKPPTT